MAVRHGLDQQALVRLARYDRRSGRSSLEDRLATVQSQLRRLLLRTVAFLARHAEDGPDRFLEEIDGGSAVGLVGKTGSRRRAEQ